MNAHHSKMALIELKHPTVPVEFKLSGRFSWQWSFSWEDEVYTWKRDTTATGKVTGYTLFVSRKPDADFTVAIFLSPTAKSKGAIQMLDYNLQRIDVSDRFGLEILMCLSVCSFMNWSPMEHPDDNTLRNSLSPKNSLSSPPSSVAKRASISPRAQRLRQSDSPPTPAKETAPNEVRVLENLAPNFLVEHCLELLKVSAAQIEVVLSSLTHAFLSLGTIRLHRAESFVKLSC